MKLLVSPTFYQTTIHGISINSLMSVRIWIRIRENIPNNRLVRGDNDTANSRHLWPVIPEMWALKT
jgi:hypothetical protein